MSKRRRRDERRPGVRVVLGSRDEALLRGLGRFRVATTDQLVRLFFRGIRKDTAAVRLRRLFDAGFLSVVSSPLNAENLYGLGPGGRRWLEDRGVACGHVPQGSLVHHLGIVDAWVRLAVALHGNTAARLVRFAPDWERRSELADTAALVVPDATIVLTLEVGQAHRKVHLFLEVDLGTERRGVLVRKLDAYGSERQVDDAGLAVILANAGERRIEAVRRLVNEHWLSWSLVCSTEEWPRALLEILPERSEVPFTPTPCGDGSHASPTPCQETPESEQGEGPSR
jgi:hypothetical protein